MPLTVGLTTSQQWKQAWLQHWIEKFRNYFAAVVRVGCFSGKGTTSLFSESLKEQRVAFLLVNLDERYSETTLF